MSSILVKPFDADTFERAVQENLFPLGIDRTTLIKDHSVSRVKLSDYLSRINHVNLQVATSTLIKGIKHVSWAEFSEQFIKCARVVLNHILSNDADTIKTCSLFGSGSVNSLNFFASYAYHHVFRDAPISVISGLSYSKISLISNYIYFDDACYSGSQLYKFLEKACKVFRCSFISKDPLLNNLNLKIYEVRKLTTEIKDSLIGKYSIIYNPDTGVFHFFTPTNRIRFNKAIDMYKFVTKWTQENPDVIAADVPASYLYIVDANINQLIRGISIYICIPYVSNYAFTSINTLQPLYDYFNVKIKFIEFSSYSISELLLPIQNSQVRSNVYTLLKNLYRWHESQIDALYPIYFDHKVASIVSTLSLLLNCGLYMKPTGVIEFYGSILNNCEANDEQLANIAKLISDNYNQKQIPDNETINKVCSYCPVPVYKLSAEEVLAIANSTSSGSLTDIL